MEVEVIVEAAGEGAGCILTWTECLPCCAAIIQKHFGQRISNMLFYNGAFAKN